MIRKTADRDHGAFDGHRVHDDIDPLALLKTRVNDWNGLVRDTIGDSDDRLHDILQFLARREVLLPFRQAAIALHIDAVCSVHHDLRDGIVIDQFLEDVQPAD